MAVPPRVCRPPPPTFQTRLRLPHALLATCPYCKTTVEYEKPGPYAFSTSPAPVHFRLECAACGKQFGIHVSLTGKASEAIPLTIHLPGEVLAIIFSFAAESNESDGALDDDEYDGALFSSSLVSKAWNAQATLALHRDVKVGCWDWRVKRSLLQTIDLRPSILFDIRSLDVCFPRLLEWNHHFYNRTLDDIYESLVESDAAKLNGASRDVLERSERAVRNPGRLREAESLTKTATDDAVGAAKAWPWMNRGGIGGDSGRRAGACELISFASRCPKLTKLRLAAFDFGEVDYDDLEARLPLSLPSITSLTFQSTDTPSPIPTILRRTSNLQSLSIDWDGDLRDLGGIGLAHLRHLEVDKPMSPAGIQNLTQFLQGVSDTLRSLSLTFDVNIDIGDSVEALLSVGRLEVLRIFGDIEGDPDPTLLPILQMLPFLHTLDTPFTVTPTFIHSLPATLVGFHSLGPRDGYDLWKYAGIIKALIDSKKTRTPKLVDVTIGGAAQGASDPDLEDLFEEASAIGLVITQKWCNL